MASFDTTLPPLPSAAARVFGISELFERIVLELIASETVSPAVRPRLVARYSNGVQPDYIEDQFRLLRINRHTYATIMNSKRTQSLCFAPTRNEAGCPIFGCPLRAVWLSLACEKFMLGMTMLGNPVLLFPVRPKGKSEVELDDSPYVSWRKYSVMPKGGPAMTLKVMQCLFPNHHKPGRICRVMPVHDDDMYFRIEQEWTLGELHDKIVEIQPGEVDIRAMSWLGNERPISMVYS
ncbi:hypothetical protein AC579_3143 [Pseudocercospora musae]|uniref:Uncharacterized protein n=1 Tax=Pseudocercospora musae TaxID=113226 RepID=A0A139H604_9PEZI|nr:hypothetical protein AC579_3143 [Pseudocercospora musae]